MNRLNLLKQKHSDSKSKFIDKISFKRRDKDTYDTYLSLYKVLKVFKLLPSTISILFAYTFINWALMHVVDNMIISSAITLVLLAGLEYMKSNSISLFAEKKINYSNYIVFAGLSILFVSLSIYSSLKGAQILINKKYESNVISSIDNSYNAKKDSIVNYYDKKIAQNESKAKDYKEANSYGGHVFRSKQKQYDKIVNYSYSIESEKQKAIEKLNSSYSKNITIANVDYDVILKAVLGCSLFIEFLIISIYVFLTWFEVRVHVESTSENLREQNVKSTSKNVKIDEYEFEEKQQKVGFEIRENPRKNRYQILFKAYFEDGVRNYPQLCKISKLNSKQVKEFISKMQ